MKRVAIFQEIIAPYRIPVFNEVHASADFEFKVYFLSETQNERLWSINRDDMKFPFEVLPGIRWEGRNLRAVHLNSGVLTRLLKGNFDLIITGGWHQPSYYLALLYARLFGKKILLWSESHGGDTRISGVFTNLLRRSFVQLSSGAIVPGKASKNYLLALGAKSEKIWTAPNAIDADSFKSKVHEFTPQLERLRVEKNLSKQNLLYVGRLVSEKGVGDLLEAYARLKPEFPDLGLLLCGDGSDRAAFERHCKEHVLQNVSFLGFLNQEDLIPYYLLADILVLPSRTEPWGLVVNEAMTCGLPVVCSSRVGAAEDLIHPGENGFVFEPGDVRGLFEHLKWLLSRPAEMKRFGEASRQIIEDYSPSRCAKGFIQAVLEA